MRYKAVFVIVEGLSETAVGSSYGLIAENKADAENEALQLIPPSGANFVKILDEGHVVSRVGFELNA